MWMRSRSALVSVFASGLLVAGLAGCQAAPTPADTTADPTSAPADGSTVAAASEAAPDPGTICAKASAAVVKSTLGFSVSEPQESFDETEIECTYRAIGTSNALVVKFRTGQDAASFARTRHDSDSTGKPTTDVTGVGDQAYASSDEFGDMVSNTLVARKGSTQLLVTAPAPVDKLKAFVVAVFAGL